MAESTQVHFTPPPTIARFMSSDKRIRGIVGPFGSGKSSGCVMELMKLAHQQAPQADNIRYSRWAIVRNTYRELEDTTKQTFLDWIPEDPNGRRRMFHESSYTYRIRHPATKDGPGIHADFVFRALDKPKDVKKLLSLELTGAWVNEAREVPVAIIDALDGRIGRYPARKDGGVTWRGIILDTNPPDVDHWWFRRFHDQAAEFPKWEIYKQPSGLSPDAENLDNLDEGYYENLASGKAPEWKKVYVDGEYGFVVDGKPVYTDYLDQTHCWHEEFGYSPDLPLLIGLDFGLTPAAVFCQKDIHGRWFVIDELVSEDMGLDRFGELLIAHIAAEFPEVKEIRLWGDPAGKQRSPLDKTTAFDMLKGMGFDPKAGPTQDPLIRKAAVSSPLRRMINGKPGMIISPKARMIRRGFMGGYQYRRLQLSYDERYTEVPDKNRFSHPHDALQYLCCGEGETDTLAKRLSTRPDQDAARAAKLERHRRFAEATA